ncbi:hypothetical protein SPIRO4BDMA_40236 [uncultured spirochete]|uniref:Uncharacterized protein n=1 Tax=uncultured spirochete TaxID=156406 RepID=A0A3P3XN13_9SPIR|nr:hypothetical protein SPIRO4BDMA_40236 [uncultured spirochete]
MKQSKDLTKQLELLKSERDSLLKDIESLRTSLDLLKTKSTELEKMRIELVITLMISEAS